MLPDTASIDGLCRGGDALCIAPACSGAQPVRLAATDGPKSHTSQPEFAWATPLDIGLESHRCSGANPFFAGLVNARAAGLRSLLPSILSVFHTALRRRRLAETAGTAQTSENIEEMGIGGDLDSCAQTCRNLPKPLASEKERWGKIVHHANIKVE